MCLTLVEFGGRILFLIYYLMIIGLNKSFITDHLLIALLHFKQKVGTIGCSSISLGIHPSPLLSSSLSFCSPLLSIVKYLNPPLRHDALCPFRRFVIPIDFNLNGTYHLLSPPILLQSNQLNHHLWMHRSHDSLTRCISYYSSPHFPLFPIIFANRSRGRSNCIAHMHMAQTDTVKVRQSWKFGNHCGGWCDTHTHFHTHPRLAPAHSAGIV